MTVVLFRVDERLIHGQVVVGWGNQLRPTRYIVVDDALAGSEWEQELYRLGLPEGAEGTFLTVEAARDRLGAWEDEGERIVVLTRNLESMVRLAREGGLEGERVNLGGIHHAPGRTRVRPYLYLDDEDRSRVRTLLAEGVRVSARDLPDSARVGAWALLDGTKEEG